MLIAFSSPPGDRKGSKRIRSDPSVDKGVATDAASYLEELPCDTAAALQMFRSRFQRLVPAAQSRSAAAARVLLGSAAPPEVGVHESISGCAAVLVSQLRDALSSLAPASLHQEIAQLRSLGQIVICAAPSGDAPQHIGDAIITVQDARAYCREAARSFNASSARAVALEFYVAVLLQHWCPLGAGLTEAEFETAFMEWSAAAVPAASEIPAPRQFARLEEELLFLQSASSRGQFPPTGDPTTFAILSSDSTRTAVSSLHVPSPPVSLQPRSTARLPRTIPASATSGSRRLLELHAVAQPRVGSRRMSEELVRCGLLIRRDGGQFVWGVPESSRLWEIVAAGRSELTARLRQRRYGEMTRDSLCRMLLARSPLSASFHVADLCGSGLAETVTAASDTFVRLRQKL